MDHCWRVCQTRGECKDKTDVLHKSRAVLMHTVRRRKEIRLSLQQVLKLPDNSKTTAVCAHVICVCTESIHLVCQEQILSQGWNSFLFCDENLFFKAALSQLGIERLAHTKH